MSDPDKQKNQKKPKKRRDDGDSGEVEREPPPPTDPVDEASWESFPASDPPAFTHLIGAPARGRAGTTGR